MAAATNAERRATLNTWIAGSRRVQRRLNTSAAIGAAMALVARFVSSTWSTIGLLIVLGVYGIGRWITFSHIADWKTRLEAIDRAERGPAKPNAAGRIPREGR